MKRYNYEYDTLNRLKNAFYKEPTIGNTTYFDEYLTYDLNGNISNLKRTAVPVGGLTGTLVDNLDYVYQGNRLTHVVENALNHTGYEGGNNIIDYDLNGNMTNMKDKGIQSIGYNYLSLADSYSITQNDPFGTSRSFSLDYLYRADGTKVRKTNESGGGKGQLRSTKITDYLDGFQYTFSDNSICLWCRTSVAYEAEAFKDIIIDPSFPTIPVWNLDFVPTSEGFYSFTENRYIYQYRDHLGNTRVNFAKNEGGNLEVLDTNNYYAFGMNHIGGVTSLFGGYQSYKYNGKELQETGMYDYGARMYMPDLGRWSVIDNKAEKYFPFSGYSYAINNPIKYLDPDGNDVVIWYKASDGKMHSYDYKYGAGYTGKNKYLLAFHKAAKALIESGAGGNLKGLDARKEKVWVREDTYDENLGPAFDRSTMSITWKPTVGGDNDNDGDADSTPTALLDHELDHALGFVTDPVEYINRTKTPDKEYDNKEEKRVITGSEQKTARKLGLITSKEVTRKGHKGALIETAGVNTIKPKATAIEEVVITVKKKK